MFTTDHLDDLDVHRVAEVIAWPAGAGVARRGSGYRVTSTCVLTATHVIAGARSVTVRFDADTPSEWLTSTSDWITADDLALLRIVPPAEMPDVIPARCGLLGDDAAIIAVHALGFPRFKLRHDAQAPSRSGSATRYRDLHHAVGWSAVLSNRRDGTLEVTVTPPEYDPDPKSSPWEGMSGSAVWMQGRIVAVISRHHGSDGLGRLTATRIDRVLEALEPGRRETFLRLLGVSENTDLPLVRSGRNSRLSTSAYLEQAYDIAPVDGLPGRERELEDIARFCASDTPYLWLQGDPWAGKSALMAWFVLHPPAGVDIVSFFVTARLNGQSDSDAFTNAVIDQLSAMIGESEPPALSPAARDGYRRKLLRVAAERASAIGRRLILAVDGLDEDTGGSPGAGIPSIAALLPKRPIAGLRVLVAGRAHPPLPADVASDHPIRTCAVRIIQPSPYARNEKDHAVWELDRLFNGGQLGRDIIGFIAASGGGLSRADLGELTGEPPFSIDNVLSGALGRSVRSHAVRSAGTARSRGYIFSHETLRSIAEERLGDTLLHGYRERIRVWAQGYRVQKWPEKTPWYLISGYARMNARDGNTQELVDLATDPARHARLFSVTGGDAAAASELRYAQASIIDQQEPDLDSMARLAAHQIDLSERNRFLPPRLPPVWAVLGQTDRAEALASSISEPSWRVQALTRLAVIEAEGGHYDRAETVARAIGDVDRRAMTFAFLIGVIARSGDHDRAEALIESITDPDRRASTQADLVGIVARSGDHQRAEMLVERIVDPDRRAAASADLVGVLARGGDHSRARSLLQKITDPYFRLQALIAVMGARGDAETPRSVQTATREIQGAVAGVTDSRLRAIASSDFSGALAHTGDHDRAEFMARSIADPQWQATALTDLALSISAAGDHARAMALIHALGQADQRVDALGDLAAGTASGHDRVRELLAAAETEADTIADPDRRSSALAGLAVKVAHLGRFDHAEQLALGITDLDWRTQTLADLAEVAVRTGNDRIAGRLVGSATSYLSRQTHERQTAILSSLIPVLVRIGDLDQAESLAATSEYAGLSVDSTTTLAMIAALTGNGDAAAFAIRAESLARATVTRHRHSRVLADLARCTAQLGHADRATKLTALISAPDIKTDTLRSLAQTAAENGHHAQSSSWARAAEELARATDDHHFHVAILVDLAATAGKVGDSARARRLVAEAESQAIAFASGEQQTSALIALAGTAARLGDDEHAERLISHIGDPSRRAQAMATLAGVTARIGSRNRCDRLVTQAFHALCALGDDARYGQAFADLVGASARVGLFAQAEAMAAHIGGSRWREQALADLAGCAASLGHFELAERQLEAVTDPDLRAATLVEMAGAAAESGDAGRINLLLASAEHSVRAIADADRRADAFADLAQAAGRYGDSLRAVRLIAISDALSRTIRDPDRRTRVVVGIAVSAARIGDHSRAERLLRDVDDSWQLQAASALVAKHVTRTPNTGFPGYTMVRRAIARNLVAPTWRSSLNALSLFAPSAVLAFADELQAIVGGGE